MKISCITIILSLFLFGCTSTVENGPLQFTQAPLLGMIYNSKGIPVTGAEVLMDNTQSSLSDINGKVVLYDVKRGEHSFIIRKTGFEEVRTTLNFLRPTQVLYTTITSMETILEELEKSLYLNDLKKSNSLLTRAKSIDDGNARLHYLNVVYLVKMKNYSEAINEIESLRKRYPESSPLVLTEIKIVLVGLEDKEKALNVLQSFPSSYRNEEINALLKTLEQEITNDR